jgi:diadenosine tetraphosphate (Ap4A) HIT family hydrolase
MDSPFAIETDKPYVAIKGKRGGYIQLATAKPVTNWADMPDELLQLAKQWCATLQAHGAKKVYWIVLAEQVEHLHIHLYPRWSDDEPRGLELFEQRFEEQAFGWDAALVEELNAFLRVKNVDLV